MAYDPTQPRDPKGTSTGGRWTSKGGKVAARKGVGLGAPMVIKDSLLSVEMRIKGQKVGYIQYRIKDSGLFINEISVEDEYQRKGFASKAIEELMKRTGASYLTKTILTPDGKRLFDSLIEKGIQVKP